MNTEWTAYLAEHDPHLQLILSDSGQVIFANLAASRLLWQMGTAYTRPEQLLPEDWQMRLDSLRAVNQEAAWDYQIEDRELHAWIKPLIAQHLFLVYLSDVTSKSNAQSADQDPLTQLPGRHRLREQLDKKLSTHAHLALFMIGIDRFQEINTALGHDQGDACLRAFADRLGNVTARFNRAENHAWAYHFEGNIFALLITDPTCLKRPAKIIKTLTDIVHDPFQLKNCPQFVTLSIGVAFYPEDGRDSQTLISNTEAAMNQAKSSGGNSYQYATRSMKEDEDKRLALENELHRAIERNELELLYQPQVRLTDNRIVGMEALMRWLHPDRGAISPEEFIPIAEETGLIRPIGEWALKTACRQNQSWQQAGLAVETVSINVSAFQFEQPDFLPIVSRVLQETGLDPRHLELEITESAIMHNPEPIIKAMRALKEAEIKLAVDDFGTGYSSLKYLKEFPIDTLKVDKSFIDSLADKNDRIITQAVIQLAHALHMKVVAEGADTQQQIDTLKAMGGDEVQGYFFSKPVTAAEMTHMLEQQFK